MIEPLPHLRVALRLLHRAARLHPRGLQLRLEPCALVLRRTLAPAPRRHRHLQLRALDGGVVLRPALLQGGPLRCALSGLQRPTLPPPSSVMILVPVRDCTDPI
jgi:hypothetical protein